MKNLFNIPSPDYLLIADKPICDQTATIRCLNGTEEIFEELHFEYTENVIVTDHTQQYAASRKAELGEEDNAFIQQVEARLRQPLNDQLVVCRIDEKVNHGVFTSEPIECGEIVTIYAGQATCLQNTHFKLPTQIQTLSFTDQQKLIDQIKGTDYTSGTDGVNGALTG